MRSRLLCLSTTALLCSLLAACGGAPNDDDLHAAFTKSIDGAMGQASPGTNDNPQLHAMLDQQRHQMVGMVNTMRIVGCKSADEGGYRCDVSMEGQVKNIRMIKDKGEWSIVAE